jgi:hypothetical protein
LSQHGLLRVGYGVVLPSPAVCSKLTTGSN